MRFAGSQFTSKLAGRILLFGSRIILSVLLWLLAVTGTLCAQEMGTEGKSSLTASLDVDSANVGSAVKLTLSFLLPEGARINSPPKITGLEDLTVLSREVKNKSIKLILLVDHLASLKDKKISLSYIDKDNNVQVISSNPISLSILSNLGEKPEEAQLRGIQDIIPGRPFWVKYLPLFAIVFAVILIIFALFLYNRKRKHDRDSMEFADPPHIRAKKEIAELEAQRLFENGDVKNFYFRFSEIMRRYLEYLRGFPAAEYTTEEISARINKEEDRTLLTLFRQADLAKFADYIPSDARKEEEVKTALSYIDSTSPVSSEEEVDSLGGITK